MKAGLYIHVPFCASRCVYCDFFSTTLGADVRRRYAEALCQELAARTQGEELASVYLGGGTPSQLGASELELIFAAVRKHFRLLSDAEVTLEANPDDITPAFVETLRSLGVNRVSLGVQTFSDPLLRLLNRRHTARQAEDAVRLLAASGLGNVSIDLIYGLPCAQGVSERVFEADLHRALALPIAHLSAYALSFERGTPLWQQREQGLVAECSDEEQEAQYRQLLDATHAAGFEHYEISNFALPGFRSRHNSAYWDGTPYIGCGPAAHSYDGAVRRWNRPDLAAYLAGVPYPPYEEEVLTPDERYAELLLTRLRTADGLCLSDVPQAYAAHLSRMAAPHLAAGRLQESDGRLRLTRSALFVSDAVISDLLV